MVSVRGPDDTKLIYAADALHIFAEIAVRQQRYSIAVVLLGAQSAAFRISPRAQLPTERTKAEETLDKARAGLDPESFDRAWDEGIALSGIEALDYALDQLGSGA